MPVALSRPRHVAFTAQHERLAVLCECTNVVTLHAFDMADGSVGPALHTCASFESMPRSVGCGIARSLASLLPTKVALLAALPFAHNKLLADTPKAKGKTSSPHKVLHI